MGFVYVFSLGHSDCCKIGHTDNIKRRLSDFKSETGSPADFAHFPVYIEVDDGLRQRIEALAHRLAEKHRQSRGEWFNLTPAESFAYIIEAANGCRADYKIHDPDGITGEGRRLLAEKQKKREEMKQLRDAEAAHRAKVAEEERQLAQKVREIGEQYRQRLELMADPGNFWLWWIGSCMALATGITMILPKVKGEGVIMISALAGLFVAALTRDWWRGKLQKKEAYVAEVMRRQFAITSAREAAQSQSTINSKPNIRQCLAVQTSPEKGSRSDLALVKEYIRKKNAGEIKPAIALKLSTVSHPAVSPPHSIEPVGNVTARMAPTAPLLFDTKQILSNKKSGVKYSLSSFDYVTSPTPGYALRNGDMFINVSDIGKSTDQLWLLQHADSLIHSSLDMLYQEKTIAQLRAQVPLMDMEDCERIAQDLIHSGRRGWRC